MKASESICPPPVVCQARHRAGLWSSFGERFFLLLLLGLLWLGPAWWDPRFLYAMGVWDLLALAAWFADLRRLPHPKQLEVRRRWLNAPMLASPTVVRLEITNRAAVPLRIQAVDDVAPTLRDEPPVVSFTVPPAATASADYSVRPRERGDVYADKVFLRYQSPWRLAEGLAVADLRQTVRIYPNLEEAKRHYMYLIRSRQIQLQRRLKRQRGLGREFESLRDYRDGDEIRDICWTATARRGKLISRVYQMERSQTLWLVLDAGRLLRARVEQLAKLDYAVNAALGLAQVALYGGDSVGLLAYGRTPQQLLSPSHGSAHLRRLLESLAQVQPQAYEADHVRAAEIMLSVQKQRALIVWITDISETPTTPDVLESALRLARRHLVLFLVLGQPEMEHLLAARPEDTTALYRYGAAQEIRGQRELFLRQLRQQGVLALETSAAHLSTLLVNQYLQIKERALL